jgi:hypothetical protein
MLRSTFLALALILTAAPLMAADLSGHYVVRPLMPAEEMPAPVSWQDGPSATA